MTLRCFQIFLVLWLIPVSAFPSHRLDIYHSVKPFDPERFIPAALNTDLTRLEPDQIPDVLKTFHKAEISTRSRDEKNLLALAIGYLHLRLGNFKTALHYLKEQILGNFILEDLRLHFESEALKGRAVEALANKKYSLAIKSVLQSIDLRLKIFKTFPDSPLHKEVSRNLAQDEKLLGDIYRDTFNYKAAWQAYRKSLMREFPDNEEHRTQVTLALAKTYEAAGQLAEAADSYILLLSDFDSPEVHTAADKFFHKNERRFQEENIDLQAFRLAMNPTVQALEAIETVEEPSTDIIYKNSAVGEPSADVTYENSAVREFYASLSQRDFLNTMETGRRVLSQYPGIREARGVARKVQKRMVSFLETNPWLDALDPITNLYPARTLAEMGLRLWKKKRPEQAAMFYKKIIKRHPLEIQLCHKSLYFLGRIFEDLGDSSTALGYYHLLLEKYDFGAYSTAALFKIPWIERLQGENEKARYHFDRLFSFYDSPAFEQWKNSYPSSDTFESAALYWAARTESDLENEDARSERVSQLIERFPLNFYSILARLEQRQDISELLSGGLDQQPAYRISGLGDIKRKRLSHAEKLISIGFLEYAEEELEQITSGRDSPAFQIYLARLFHLAHGFQNSIRLHWSVFQANKGSALSDSLAQGLFPRARFEAVEVSAGGAKLDPWFILSLMRQESAFNEKIVSSANAIGLMQLLPTTAAEVARSIDREPPEAEQLKDPQVNIVLGVEYLNRLLNTFDGNAIYALAAYNAGENKVNEWIELRGKLEPVAFIESIPYNETRNYVKKILRNYAIYLTLYQKERVNGLKELLTKVRD
ncbi:MAG: lytic transglycosylase domain-containing protein [Nitrospinae bacterium]|nr:lytic transglycosylase domain-containing protein [Nitrospinota bacterium]